MSTFLSYSPLGALVGGFRPLAIKDRGAPWRVISDNDANTPAWLDLNVVIFQQGAYIDDGHKAFLKTTDGRIFPRKASRLFAGGGRWAASYEGWVPVSGLPPGSPAPTKSTAIIYDGMDRILYGDPDPDSGRGTWGAGQHSVGLDGTLAYCPRYHAGRTVIVEDRDRRLITRGENIPVTSTCVIDREAVAVFSAADINAVWFWNGSTWRRWPLAFPCYEGQIVRWSGAIYVIEGSEQIAVHRLEDPSAGWTFGRPGKGYNAVGWEDRGDGRLWIAWSENAGATVDSVREAPLTGAPAPWPVPPIEPFTHTAAFAPYDTFSERYGNTTRLIGNVVFPDKARLSAVPSSLPLVAAFDTYRSSYAARYRYYYLHAGATIGSAKSQFEYFAGKPARDFLLYLDSRTWPDVLPSWVPKWAILCGQAYIDPGESLARFEDAMIAMFAKVAKFGRPMGITTCHYDRNGTVPVDTVRALTPIYARLIRKFKLVAVQPFSDMRKGEKFPGGPLVGGMVVHPVLYDEAAALFALFPSGPLPSFVPDEPEPEPGRVWFRRVGGFMSGESMRLRGLQKQTSWNPNADGNGHRPIWGFVRPDPDHLPTGPAPNNEGAVLIGNDTSNRPDNPQDDAPDPASAVVLTDRGGGRVDVAFVEGGYQLTQMPGGEIQLRMPGAIDLQEYWYDGILGGAKQTFHLSGTALKAIE